ncbi:MAG: hypothetical protein ACOCW6_07950 [Spirochaetota bacterium]
MRDRTLGLLVAIVALGASVAAAVGAFWDAGPGPFEHLSVRGSWVTVYGRGAYRHMSADVAIQGIAQDYITLFLAVPALIASYLSTARGGIRARLVLGGVLFYLFVTYLFYLIMGTYNELFLLYVLLLGTSFFAVARLLFAFPLDRLPAAPPGGGTAAAGIFLMVNAILIGAMWIGVILPPLLTGELYPEGLDHYTTMIVQGMDLALLLPLSFVCGSMLRRGLPLGHLLGRVYLVFLSILMIALSAKILAMGLSGVNIIPAVFIIPGTALVTIFFTYITIRPLDSLNAGP